MRSIALVACALGTAALASAQPMGHMVDQSPVMCTCPGKSRPLGNAADCEEACYGSRGRAPVIHDDGAERSRRAQQAAVEQARRDAEALQRKRDQERRDREFEATKADALRSLKGVSVEPNELKGVIDTGGDGLKGLVPARTELKGLDEPAPRAAQCRIVESCKDSLAAHEKSLDAARREQSDLYMAVGTADFLHGAGEAWERVGETVKNAPEYRVWRDKDDGKDAAGFPLYARDYKTSVNDLRDTIERQRAAAWAGKYDPKKTGLLKSPGMKGLTPRDLKEKYEEMKAKCGKMRRYEGYMEDLKRCADGPASAFAECVQAVNAKFNDELDDLPVGSATVDRIKAAAAAYTRYTTRALQRGMEAADSASRCFKGCQ